MKASRSFVRTPEMVRESRRFVADTLFDVPSETLETIQLLVSELTSNALLHTDSGFTLSIERLATAVWVGVDDDGAGEVSVRSPSVHELHGRGLQIVSTLSDEWGATDAVGGGKQVWFRLDLHSDGASAGIR